MKNCKIENCKNKYYAKGLCDKHYRRVLRHDNPFHAESEFHGMYGTSEYIAWKAMIQRCCNKNNIGYKYYGGRGITVCNQWRKSFKAFYEDMGLKPFPKAQIDRSDNDLGYFHANCRWTTAAKNQQNKSNNKLTIERAKAIRRGYKSSNITQRKLASIYGVCQSTIGEVINQKIWK